MLSHSSREARGILFSSISLSHNGGRTPHAWAVGTLRDGGGRNLCNGRYRLNGNRCHKARRICSLSRRKSGQEWRGGCQRSDLETSRSDREEVRSAESVQPANHFGLGIKDRE